MIHRAEPLLGKHGMLQKFLGQILVRARTIETGHHYTVAQAHGPEIIMASLSWPIISSTAQSRID
jgi:hypothetical protein